MSYETETIIIVAFHAVLCITLIIPCAMQYIDLRRTRERGRKECEALERKLRSSQEWREQCKKFQEAVSKTNLH